MPKIKLICFCLLLAFILSSCSEKNQSSFSSTISNNSASANIAETIAPTVTPTPTEAPTPTEVAGPTMESLPAEWQGKIDHIETMTNMDGKTQRVVAVEALTDEDKAAGKTEAKLRVLEWDGKEWISYVPQVGKVSAAKGDWDLASDDGWTPRSGLSTVESNVMSETLPVYGKDGKEIRLGSAIDLKDATLICVDVAEAKVDPDDGYVAFVFKDILPTGDYLLLLSLGTLHYPSGSMIATYNQEGIDSSNVIDLSRFKDKSIEEVLGNPGGITSDQYKAYVLSLADGKPHRIIISIPKFDYIIMSDDSPLSRKEFASKIAAGEVFDDTGIGIDLANMLVIPQEKINSLSAK